jgi:2,4-dienoyl-CoA reductase-like NADH-dependent reductase (Old Yellow Enzyme family)
MTTGEVEAVVEDFAEAVRRARDAGLDCVQIHAAHGYAMVGSFLSPFFNKRTDRYGGSLENRLQFLLEIIASSRAKVGPDFAITLRMSGDERRTGGRTTQETQFIARTLAEAGVDCISWGSAAPGYGTCPECTLRQVDQGGGGHPDYVCWPDQYTEAGGVRHSNGRG